MRSGLGVWCIFLLLGCGGGNQKPAETPAADPDRATVDEAVAMFVEMGRVVMKAGADCDRMATGVNGWIDDNGPRRKQVTARLAKLHSPELRDAYRDGLGEHLDVIQAMRVGLEGCQHHAGFMQAWSRLDE